jgi:hypothetical protein
LIKVCAKNIRKRRRKDSDYLSSYVAKVGFIIYLSGKTKAMISEWWNQSMIKAGQQLLI